MNTETIVQIVPSLPPQNDGIGDYAMNLAIRLRKSEGIQTQFIVCNPEWSGPERIDGFMIRRLRYQNEAGIWSLLASIKVEQAVVLLHYAGYGYQRQGVPLWLYRGIKSWLAEGVGASVTGQKQLATIFHELWMSSKRPWRGEFYLQKPQRWLIEGLHRQSKFSVATTKRKQALLEGIQRGKTFWLSIPKGMLQKENDAIPEAQAPRGNPVPQALDSRWRVILTDLIVGSRDKLPTTPLY
jgi:hypothetical protein